LGRTATPRGPAPGIIGPEVHAVDGAGLLRDEKSVGCAVSHVADARTIALPQDAVDARIAAQAARADPRGAAGRIRIRPRDAHVIDRLYPQRRVVVDIVGGGME